MKLTLYHFRVFRTLPGFPGGDFAPLDVRAYSKDQATRLAKEVLTLKKQDDYDWRYSPIMLYYDYELIQTTTN